MSEPEPRLNQFTPDEWQEIARKDNRHWTDERFYEACRRYFEMKREKELNS